MGHRLRPARGHRRPFFHRLWTGLAVEPLETRRLLSANAGKASEFIADEIIVGFSGSVAAHARQIGGAAAAIQEAARLTAGQGLANPRLLAALDAVTAHVPTVWQLPAGADLQKTIDALKKLPGVAYAEPNWRVSIDDLTVQSTIPNDPQFGDLWGLDNTGQLGGTVDADIDAPEAWDISIGSSNVVVGVIDTGVDYNHPDLQGNIWTNPGEVAGNGLDDDGNGYIDDLHGYDFVNNDGDPMDDNFHGTHVSGTIGASGDNGVGVTGVNWNVQIMGLKFLDSAGNGSTADAVAALNYAALMRGRGVNILLTNNSWGGGGFSQALEDAISANAAAGMLFVAAAGNGGSDGVGDDNDVTPNFPSNYAVDNVLAVAALNRNDGLAGFSNFGLNTVDLGAPGVTIWSTGPNNTYFTLNGTSMATPHVAGVAALAWSVNPSAGYQQVRDAILDGVDPVTALDGISVTGGRLNALNTLTLMGPPVPQPPRVISSTPTGSHVGPIDSITINFSESMNQGSFSVAADVLSFTGPGGANLVPDISAFTWVDNNSLRISFAAQASNGAYSLTLGPNVLAADNDEPLDQNNNGTPGEAGDGYTAGFTLSDCMGPDGFGYLACLDPLQAIDLAIGGPNVAVALDSVDDGSAQILLGGNTFNFYGTTYNSLFVSSNGLITFGLGNSEYLNGTLTNDVLEAAIAVLWDDLTTHVDAADVVLYQLDATNHRLIIEWSQVQHYPSSDAMTFQAILELNSGASPGDIVFNYPDLLAGGGLNNGASATVGIKAAGVQGSERLLVSSGGVSPFVQTGRAIRFSTDVVSAGNIFVSGPSTAFRGEALTFDLSAAGPSVLPTDSITYQIDWNGDSITDQTVVGPASGVSVPRAYTDAGNFVARVGGTHNGQPLINDVHPIAVNRYVLRPNSGNPNLTDLVFGGTPGVDGVYFYVGSGANTVNIVAQFENTQNVNLFNTVSGVTGRVIAFGYDSSDALVAEFLVNHESLLYGGNGDDVLVGGLLGDVLDGGAGNDVLIGGTQPTDAGDLLAGGAGNDLLLGHRGSDLLSGGIGEDLLVGDALNFGGALPTAVFYLQSEWLSGRPYPDRVANLLGVGIGPRNNANFFLQPGTTVLNDAAIDTLMSNLDGSLDWFIFRLAQDLLSNPEPGETQTGT